MLRSTAFKISFLTGICLFALLNAFGYQACHSLQLTHELDCQTLIFFDAYGIPFAFYLVATGPPRVGSADVFWVEAVADVLIALICSVLIGLAFTSVYSKIKTHREIQD